MYYRKTFQLPGLAGVFLSPVQIAGKSIIVERAPRVYIPEQAPSLYINEKSANPVPLITGAVYSECAGFTRFFLKSDTGGVTNLTEIVLVITDQLLETRIPVNAYADVSGEYYEETATDDTAHMINTYGLFSYPNSDYRLRTTRAIVSVEDNDIRWRIDGQLPVVGGAGQILKAGDYISLSGFNPIIKFAWRNAAAGANATVKVQFVYNVQG